MPKGPPKRLAILNDDYSAQYVGKAKDGRQFFLTTPFVPGKREYIALYVFDKKGALLEATIDDLGPREGMDEDARVKRRDDLLASLGATKYCRILVQPFTIKRFGVEFGLIPTPPSEPDEDWCVIVQPGDYMCFWPPWTSGDYDT